MDLKKLDQHATSIRKRIIEMVYTGKSSHVGTALSCVDILTVLYFAIMNIDPKAPDNLDRDRFILSKGHGCTAQYATLAERGFFDPRLLEQYYQDGGLPGHATQGCVPGIEVSTGSLGHGLGLGVGMAYAAKMDQKSYRVFVVLGDGECNEGSVWESILAAAHWKLDHLTVIVDHNNLQGCGTTDEVMNLRPFEEKWKAFGWETKTVNGHNLEALVQALKSVPFHLGKPSVIIAETTKGKGVSYMENQLEWHYRSPNSEQREQALQQINTI